MTAPVAALPPFALAPHVYYALVAEGYTAEDATVAVWEHWDALQAQREAFVKGARE